jgi:hypothetical protein
LADIVGKVRFAIELIVLGALMRASENFEGGLARWSTGIIDLVLTR